ncbi:MAG TPA: Bax inhibitor-1 family protein [Holophagaceae bacterium]|nr:Bax inhibitor-1 family protein [Holophagaceae bacterium]
MDHLQPSWQHAESGVEARIRFVRSVYAWLMAGFLVACLGALASLATVSVWIPLLRAGGQFAAIMICVAQFGALWFARAKAHEKGINVFAYGLATGVSGYIAGMISFIYAAQSGPAIVYQALGLTALAFLTLTTIAFVTKKDFSFLGSFVMVGLVIAIVGSLVAMIFHLPAFSVLISCIVVIACSAKILWDTSAMLRTADYSNPVGFALSLFVSLYNIFISLLNILGRRR